MDRRLVLTATDYRKVPAMLSELATRVGLCYFAAVMILGGTLSLIA